MFEFLFWCSGNYELNRKLTLNATKLSEQVKKTLWPKALVVGGGIFGTTSAVALANNGYQVELHEELEDVMMAASILINIDYIKDIIIHEVKKPHKSV